jgi:hypothetical protein
MSEERVLERVGGGRRGRPFGVALITMFALLVAGSTSQAATSCVAKWRVLASNPSESQFFALRASPPANVWAVGTEYLGVGSVDFYVDPLVQRWDGTRWRGAPEPALRAGTTGGLFDVAVISSTDVWTVGRTSDESTGRSEGLLAHWDGSGWALSPPVAVHVEGTIYDSELEALVAITSSDIWAILRVHKPGPRSAATPDQLFAVHWDGTSWSLIEK